jgi:hypothetical protein
MTKDEKLKHLERWANVINESDQQIDALCKVTGTCDCPLIESLWKLQDFATDMTTEFVQGRYECLRWYHFENDMGTKGLKVLFEGKLKPIKSLEDLVWLLETEK